MVDKPTNTHTHTHTHTHTRAYTHIHTHTHSHIQTDEVGRSHSLPDCDDKLESSNLQGEWFDQSVFIPIFEKSSQVSDFPIQ